MHIDRLTPAAAQRRRLALSFLPLAATLISVTAGAQASSPAVTAPALGTLLPGESVRLWQRTNSEPAATRSADVSGHVAAAGPSTLTVRDARNIDWQFTDRDMLHLEVQRGRRRSFRAAAAWTAAGLGAGSLIALGMKMQGAGKDSYRTSTRNTVMGYRWAMGLGAATGFTAGALLPHARWVPVAVGGDSLSAPISVGSR